jgi:aminoglycoside phosphotransferase (APT) family kinase protein
MLSRADAELARRDRDLPGFSRLLDADAMAEELFSLGFRDLVGVTADYVRYKPGSSCLVGYRLRIGVSEFRAHGKIFADPVGAKAEKARSRATWQPDPDALLHRGGGILMEKSGALLSFYPFDADLPALRRFEDTVAGPPLRKRVFRDFSEIPADSLEILAYKPERRLVARLASPSRQEFVVRFYATPEQERASRLARWVSDGEYLRIAKRVGGSKSYSIAALEWLPGTDLRDLVRFESNKVSESLEIVTRAIAEFHHSSAALRAELPEWDPRQGTIDFARTIGWLSPPNADRATSLADRIVSALSDQQFERKLVHGDLYDKQIVLMNPGVGLLDLDQIGVGDPRQDLGLFLAHWERDRILGQLGKSHAEIAEELVLYYERATGSTLVGLPVFVAAALFRLAQHPFRNRLEDWPRVLDAILTRVGELLEQR